MWRTAAVVLLVCAGCASHQQSQDPPRRSWLPNTDIVTQDADTFFGNKHQSSNPLPVSNDAQRPATPQ